MYAMGKRISIRNLGKREFPLAPNLVPSEVITIDFGPSVSNTVECAIKPIVVKNLPVVIQSPPNDIRTTDSAIELSGVVVVTLNPKVEDDPQLPHANHHPSAMRLKAVR
jgi:hypothetical protein